jgi:hypothetical protein
MAEPSGGEAIWYEWPTPTSNPSLGMGALEALVDLSEDAPIPTGDHRRWYVSDYEALLSSLRLEEKAKSEGIPTDAPSDVRTELNGYLDSFYVALPFTEVERGIVHRVYGEPREAGKSHRDIPGQIRKQQFEVVSAGLRTVVRGRDLMRRWWAWRRELDEFEGQGSLEQAKLALVSFTGRIVPPEKMPNVFYNRQGQKRPVPYRR